MKGLAFIYDPDGYWIESFLALTFSAYEYISSMRVICYRLFTVKGQKLLRMDKPQSTSQQQAVILHVLLVAFHHKNGPQLEYAYPPLPMQSESLSQGCVPLPEEWSFMPFMCLPDGAHATEEEFIYFHLPPVKAWDTTHHRTTLFGLACFRQIDAKELLHKEPDVTRTKVQKSVVVIATHNVLGSVRSKLGMVTQGTILLLDLQY